MAAVRCSELVATKGDCWCRGSPVCVLGGRGVMGILCSNLVSKLLGEVAPPAGQTPVSGWHSSVWELIADIGLLWQIILCASTDKAETASS